jgi:hypothetical protein
MQGHWQHSAPGLDRQPAGVQGRGCSRGMFSLVSDNACVLLCMQALGRDANAHLESIGLPSVPDRSCSCQMHYHSVMMTTQQAISIMHI